MFNTPDFPASLDEEVFGAWLENGRSHKISYSYLIVIWDEVDTSYKPFYTETREEMEDYKASGYETVVAAYDLYSESRVK